MRFSPAGQRATWWLTAPAEDTGRLPLRLDPKPGFDQAPQTPIQRPNLSECSCSPSVNAKCSFAYALKWGIECVYFAQCCCNFCNMSGRINQSELAAAPMMPWRHSRDAGLLSGEFLSCYLYFILKEKKDSECYSVSFKCGLKSRIFCFSTLWSH